MRSAIITTYQSEKTIGHSLESIKDIVDSVCVVDGRWKKYPNQTSTVIMPDKIDEDQAYVKLVESIESVIPNFSVDNTLEICESYKNKFKHFHIIQNKERIYELDARAQALRYILSMSEKSSWIYLIDSDEMWTDSLKKEIIDIEKQHLADFPYRIKMRAKNFVNLNRFYYSTYMRGFKNCSMLCDFFSHCNTIPFYDRLPVSTEYYVDEKIPHNFWKATNKSCDIEQWLSVGDINTKSYFLHYTIHSLSSNLLKSLCYGSFGIKSFLENVKKENNNSVIEYYGATRQLEEQQSLELLELGFKD